MTTEQRAQPGDQGGDGAGAADDVVTAVDAHLVARLRVGVAGDVGDQAAGELAGHATTGGEHAAGV